MSGCSSAALTAHAVDERKRDECGDDAKSAIECVRVLLKYGADVDTPLKSSDPSQVGTID